MVTGHAALWAVHPSWKDPALCSFNCSELYGESGCMYAETFFSQVVALEPKWTFHGS